MRHFSLQTLTMSLKVTLLVVSLIAQCCSAPSRRNWTPQAILYLKGFSILTQPVKCRSFSEGHRSTLERSSREEEGAYHLGLLFFALFNDLLIKIMNKSCFF
uniref:Spexin hormone n=1 Tax=Cyprinodon variegatus TaxID=28743 RepID=A0A3Q2FPT1_CYPVA